MNRFIIPDGYTGWFYVYYRVDGKEALKTEDGYNLLIIPKNGLLETSSSYEPGIAKDEFFYVRDNKRTRISFDLVWPGSYGSTEIKDDKNKAKPTTTTFVASYFIGTEKKFRQAVK